MALRDFLTAVARESAKVAPQYGLTPQELQLALITTAGLEGGLGETAGVGDGGQSVGRFQWHTGGGFGTTMLNRGYSLEQITEDDFQVTVWAPLLAQSIANAKKQGYTGGEAIRQGAFAAERPAEIYPADRFNSVIEQASGLIGETPPIPGGSGGGLPVNGSEAATIRRGLQQRALELWETFQTTQSPEDYAAFQGALVDIGLFEDAMPDSADPDDAAQQAFENSISLGDFEGREADRLYNRWRDKAELARTAAEGEIAMRTDHNERNVQLQEALNTSMTPGLLPRPTDAGYIAPNYERILNRWNERLGVGNEPAAAFDSGITLPGAAAGATALPGGDGAAAAAMKGTAQGAITGIDLSVRKPKFEEYPGAWGEVPFAKPVYNVLAGLQGKEVPGSRQLDEKLLYTYGKYSGKAGGWLEKQIGNAASGAKKNTKKWWNNLTNPASYKFGIPGYAAGTMDHPGGPAMVNERGPETIIGPDGMPQQLPGAAQVMNLPAGSAVLPAGIPSNEAFYFAQIKRGLAQGGGNPDTSPQAQMARANDPQLREKVLASIRRAAAAEDAAHPPYTPILGPGITKDYWQDWRPLTGVPAQGQPQQGVQ